MKNILYVSLTIWLFAFAVNAQEVEKSFKLKDLKVVYHQKDGMYDGLYTSYYLNGNKKAEGLFNGNMRVGNWTIWDENGNILVEREYQNSFVFDQKTPSKKQFEKYSLVRDENGVIPAYFLQEKNIDWLQRVWRSIPAENNPELFDDNKLYTVIWKSISEGKITGYNPKDDQFKFQIAADLIDFTNTKVLSYKIKEESFYDHSRQIMESRIIGICPIVLDEETGSPKDLVWIYYPDFREILAQYPVQDGRVPDYVRSLEDVFFYRYFNSQIIKVSNLKDQSIEDYKSDSEIEVEATKLDLLLIVREHDFWVK